MAKKIIFFIADCALGFFYLFLVFVPAFFFYLGPKWEEERQAEIQRRYEEYMSEDEEESLPDPDESLKYFIGDVGDTDIVDAIYINESNNTVFVCVLAQQNYSEEYLQAAYDLEKVFAYVAEDSRRPRELCIVGRGADGTCYWTIDRQGTVADRNGNLIRQF